jgi:hypothetical protein
MSKIAPLLQRLHTPRVRADHALKWRSPHAFCVLGCLMRKTWLRSPTQSYSENWVSFPQHNLLQWKRRYGSGLVFSLPTALSLEGF